MPRTAVCLLMLAAAGCGDGRPAVYPTEVAVTAGGKPAPGVTVFLHPAAPPPGGGRPVRPVGVTGPNGVARLTSYAAHDGAAAGGYVVTLLYEPTGVRPGGAPQPDVRIPAGYGDPAASPLRATVEPKPMNALRAVALPSP